MRIMTGSLFLSTNSNSTTHGSGGSLPPDAGEMDGMPAVFNVVDGRDTGACGSLKSFRSRAASEQAEMTLKARSLTVSEPGWEKWVRAMPMSEPHLSTLKSTIKPFSLKWL